VTARFRRRSGGAITADFDVFEAQLLRVYTEQLRDLLAPDEAEAGADPLEEMTGMTFGAPPERPDNPVLGRLLPDAYGPGGAEPPADQSAAERAAEAEAAGEFRRLTERDLRNGKVADAEVLLATLPPEGGRLKLTEEQCDQWLRALNDIRLAIGTQIGVTEDHERMLADLAPGDPRAAAYDVYNWLSVVQETLVRALAG
jgi:hypothetical protein